MPLEFNKMIQELNFITFDQAISKGLVLVDFWADWCEPCKVQFPILQEIDREQSGIDLIAKVDISENRFIANKQKVLNIPTMVLYKDGVEIMRFNGVYSKEMLLNKIIKNK